MEHLNKHQLILVALLVSFVTSIATGIVTVSLVNQAPPAVTQTINRVVEKTIERVVPETQGAAVVTKETIVVRQEDFTIKAVEKNSKGIVRITGQVSPVGDSSLVLNSAIGAETLVPDRAFIGLGVIINKDGVIIVNKQVLGEVSNLIGTFADGTVAPLKLLGIDEDGLVTVLQINPGPDQKDLPSFTPVVLGDSDKLMLGQSVIAVGGKKRNSIALGIVSSLIIKDEEVLASAGSLFGKDTVVKRIQKIETDIDGRGPSSGGILLNLSGEVVGINLSNGAGSEDGNSYTGINLAKIKSSSVLEGLKAVKVQ